MEDSFYSATMVKNGMEKILKKLVLINMEEIYEVATKYIKTLPSEGFEILVKNVKTLQSLS